MANEIAAKSLGYIAILALVSVTTFVVLMDVLKYGFGIDPARAEQERLQRQKLSRKRRAPVIQRFIYVHESPSVVSDEIPSIQETTVWKELTEIHSA